MINQEKLIEIVLFLTAVFSILIVALIFLFVVAEGSPIFEEYGFFKFIFSTEWSPSDGEYGIFTMIVGSIYITFLSLLMAIPLSLLCAIFMSEIAPKNMRQILKPVIETLAGIPSVVYGFFGLTLIVPFMRTQFGGTGFGLLTGSVILTIMILPHIISVSVDALRAVPREYREASLALGATPWQTISYVTVPTAMPGIVTAIILGMGRAIGETLAIIMVAGNVTQIPTSLTDPVRTLTSNIALEMSYASSIHYNALFGTAVILFVIIMLLIIFANYYQNKKTMRY